MAKGKFIFGALMGALLGLAFAPKKGSELRKEIQSDLAKGGRGEEVLKKNAAIIGEDITETAQEVYHNPEVQKQIAKGKKEAEKLVHHAQKKLQESGEEWVQMARTKLTPKKTHTSSTTPTKKTKTSKKAKKN
jgi:gas vesicle protein